MIDQPTFLNDDVVEHHRGPALTGQQEFALTQQTALVDRMHGSVADWRPPDLPDLSHFDEVFLDLETTGLRWWDEDRMIGMGLWTPDGVARYLPIRHRVGPNIPEKQFFEWVRRELRDKRVVNIRTKFDLHMLRVDGVDLEQQGCTFGDVAHYAALLDDHRREFNQEDLALAYLAVPGVIPAEECKVTVAHGYDLDPAKFAEYPAGLVAPRAEGDVRIVRLLHEAMWPQLTAQDLHRVRKVEDQIIPVVVEMEHNGAPIDVDLLNDWVKRATADVERLLYEIYRATAVRMATPNKRDDLSQLFHALRIPIPRDAETEQESYADELLEAIDHPVILKLRAAIAIQSLLSKFLIKYQRTTARDGILRYELHQLPFEKEEKGGGRGGAVSGRFSSAATTYYLNGVQKKEGANIQQVFGVKSQLDPKRSFNPTGDYIVRKLFKPDRRANPQAVWFSSDMRQVEFRRFVHFSRAPRLIKSYRDDPLTDYHQLVHGMIVHHTGKDFDRTFVKNINFESLYGGGLIKLASMVREINQRVYQEMRERQERIMAKRDWTALKDLKADPRIAKTKSLYDTYHAMFPEVKTLLAQASDTAEKRGYVMTALGRRARFHPGDRMYSALNRVIQGTAADDHKVALIDVHRERHRLGFLPRMTVHDELGGDLHDPGLLPQMAQFLNEQRLESQVPILWSSNIGPNWAEAK